MNSILRGLIGKKRFSIGSLPVTGWLLLACTSWAFAGFQPPAVSVPGETDAVVITLTRLGPYPSSIRHTAAPFVLCIVNRSGVLDDTFSVVQVSGPGQGNGRGPSLLDLRSTRAKQRDRGLTQLIPGTYQFVSQSHPGWIVTITIGAN